MLFRSEQPRVAGRGHGVARHEHNARRLRGDDRGGTFFADPARNGLGKEGAAAVVATQAPRVVLVSCDAVAAARDARLLVDADYSLVGAEVLDLFPHTHHVEVVSTFERA